MGKKKIAKQTTEEALKEQDVLNAAMGKVAVKAPALRLERGRIYVSTSYNNTLISVTDEAGNLIAWSSAGALGFSGPKKATPFAASKVVAALAEKVQKSGPFTVEVYVSGIGGGRDSAIRSLANHGFNITAVRDVTPIPHNGPRPPKVRRV